MTAWYGPPCADVGVRPLWDCQATDFSVWNSEIQSPPASSHAGTALVLRLERVTVMSKGAQAGRGYYDNPEPLSPIFGFSNA